MRIVGVDTGGTFTDLALVEGREVRIEKVRSTPRDPAAAIVEGLRRISPDRPPDLIIHGTTIALNALLTGRVARTAFVTNEGFRDLVEIARQDRPELYALEPRKPAPLVPRELRFEIGERSAPVEGSSRIRTERRGTRAEIARLRLALRRAAPEAIAIGFLHAWADPRREQELARALAALGIPITCSGTLLAQHREFERFNTAIVNAALVPLMRAYLARLEGQLKPSALVLLQSTGGTLPTERAAAEPARVLLSGPAGGIAAAARTAAELGLDAVLTLDMGGTSTDVGFHTSAARRSRGAEAVASGTAEPARIAGQVVALPALDLHTIGCGGGSLLWVDAGGALHVGPASAGADPGPACFGKSLEPTLTDAHVVLGHLHPQRFLGGRFEVDASRSELACSKLARRAGARRAEDVAAAAIGAARAAMRRALAVMTLERGRDPRGLALVAFGGAGGLHAAALAESLHMRCAIVPLHPGALSALGMARASGSAERVRTLLVPLESAGTAQLERAFRQLERSARAELGQRAPAARVERRLELRYVGQSFELSIPAGPRAAQRFHAAHEQRYGYRIEDRPIELVALRVRLASAPPRALRSRLRTRPAPAGARLGTQRVWLGEGRNGAWRAVPAWAREALEPGCALRGPAVISEFSCTTLLPAAWRARVVHGGHLWLEK
jgi:N-methylhydantoinase A